MPTKITDDCKEDKVKKRLRELCKEHGALANHVPSSQFSKAGTCDYIILNQSGVTFYVEVKRPKGGDLTRAQEIFRDEIKKRNGFYLLYNGYNEEELIKYLIHEI